MLAEKNVKGISGWVMLPSVLALMGITITALIGVARDENVGAIVALVLVLIVEGLCLGGLTVVNPNTAKVLQVFGAYTGTVKEQGFRWVNPLSTRRTVSLRVRNFES